MGGREKIIHHLLGDEVIRRYAVMNAFDGLMTTLGILLGAYISGTLSSVPYLALMGGVSMFVSGLVGAYLTERAERERDIREMERHLGRSLSNTEQYKMARLIVLITGLVDGASPLLVSLFLVTPFLFLPPIYAFFSSLILSFLLVVVLGHFLAAVSGDRPLNYIIRMLVGAGVVVAVSLLFQV